MTRKAKFRGKSGIDREVDIAIQQKIGQFDVLIAIDCKDYAQPVDIKPLEASLGLFKDIGARS